MSRIADMRRVAACFGALFLLAQIFGVVPIISEHAAHVAQASLGVCNAKVVHGHCHYHGDADGFLQHHELQDLCGAFSRTIAENENPSVRVATVSCADDIFSQADPALLERPPKHVLSV